MCVYLRMCFKPRLFFIKKIFESMLIDKKQQLLLELIIIHCGPL